jgi:hypothetical protein
MPFRHGRAPVLDLIGDDPAIHPLRKTLAKVDGYAGLRRAEGLRPRRRVTPDQVGDRRPRMTRVLRRSPDAAQRAALRGVVRC